MQESSKYSGLLTGPDPTQKEEHKTLGQLEDERESSAMTHAKSNFDSYDDEDDGAPAIEQRVKHEGIMIGGDSHTNTKPKLQASSAFAEEMHKRSAAEKEARERARRMEEAKAEIEAEKKEKELEAKLEKAQEMDPETIKEEFKEQAYQENKEKLYPDARPFTSDIEEKLWERRAENGEQIAPRAKLETALDSELSNAILVACAFQILGFILTVVASLIGDINIWLARILMIIGLTSVGGGIIWLTNEANRAKHREIPSDQWRQFKLATAIPGVLIRTLFITGACMVPVAGKYVGPFLGCAIAASLHYMYINRFGVEVSIFDTLCSFLLFLIIYGLSFLRPTSIDSAPSLIINAGFMLIGFLLGDILAMRIALLTKK